MGAAKLEVPILMYHRIGDRVNNSLVRDQYVPEKLFESQLRVLKKHGFQAISLDEMRDLFAAPTPLPFQPVVITFDDGYESFISRALPILLTEGMKATVFLVANCVGRTNRWDEAKGDVTEPLMTWDHIRKCLVAGTEFGAHTLNHPDLRFCDDALAEKEIADSKLTIETNLGVPVHWFSYPYGKHNERERRMVRDAGYLGATGTDKKVNDLDTDPHALGRINVRATSSPGYLMHKLRKAMQAR